MVTKEKIVRKNRSVRAKESRLNQRKEKRTVKTWGPRKPETGRRRQLVKGGNTGRENRKGVETQ